MSNSGIGAITKVPDLWMKLMAAMLHKYRAVLPREIHISGDDLLALEKAYANDLPTMIVGVEGEGKDEHFVIKLTTIAEGQRKEKEFRDRLLRP